MKQRVRTLLEEDVLRRAKRRAADEGRPLSDLIQDALEKYLTAGLPESAHCEAAFQRIHAGTDVGVDFSHI